jgi:hypothetical protein
MARSVAPSVCLERLPHREAIARLREAYRRLWLAGRQPPAQAKSVAKATITVQEVSS